MRNGDGPVRDDKRGTRDLNLPAEGTDGMQRPTTGIPEQQALPHPEDTADPAADAAQQSAPTPGPYFAGAQGDRTRDGRD